MNKIMECRRCKSLKSYLNLTHEEDTAFQKSKELECNYYIIEKLLSESIDKNSLKSLPIFSTLKEHGILITYYVKICDFPKRSEEFVLNMLFASRLTKKDLDLILFDQFEEIFIE
jgi:hypothetical protein